MGRLDLRAVGGILLIAAGILFLLQNLGIVAGVLTLLWALFPGVSGAVFLYVFLTNRTQWWTVIPGFALLSLAALIAVSQLLPEVGDALGGTLFLGGIGLAFLVLCLADREHWWGVIPGGVLLTLALVAGLSPLLEGVGLGGVFFLGLGLTFGLLSLVPTPEERMKWALIPATVLLAMGLLMTSAATGILKYLWPVALILAGLYLIFRVFFSRQGE